MSGTVELLTKQLAALDHQAEELEASLRTTYGSYLNALAKTLRQQLILASYYICTEGYPEDFLKLPLSQRHNLQTRLKAITQETRIALESLLLDPQPSPPPSPSSLMGSGHFFPGHAIVAAFEMPSTAIAIDVSLDGEGEFNENTTDILEVESLNDLESTLEQIQDQMKRGIFDSSLDDEDEDDEEDDEDDEEDENDRSNPNDRRKNNSRRGMTESNARELQAILAQVAAAISAKEPTTPIDRLTTWQENLERGIQEKIRLSSYKTNQALQKSTLIPAPVPDRALEAASRVDNDANSPVSHVVQMLVEMGRPSDPESGDHPKRTNAEPFGPNVPKLIHVVALQLRLGELEFNDPILMRWRNRLRELANNTQTLTQKYRKCQHKRSVAEAQDAWRSSWTSDEL